MTSNDTTDCKTLILFIEIKMKIYLLVVFKGIFPKVNVKLWTTCCDFQVSTGIAADNKPLLDFIKIILINSIVKSH